MCTMPPSACCNRKEGDRNLSVHPAPLSFSLSPLFSPYSRPVPFVHAQLRERQPFIGGFPQFSQLMYAVADSFTVYVKFGWCIGLALRTQHAPFQATQQQCVLPQHCVSTSADLSLIIIGRICAERQVLFSVQVSTQGLGCRACFDPHRDMCC